MRGFVKGVFVVLALSIVSPAVPAVAADIVGVVLGPGTVPLPGVAVTATNSKTGATFKTVTNESGQYQVEGLAAGTYTVTAVLPGFHAETHQVVVDEGEGKVQVDFSLKPEVAGSIMVTATRRETDVQTTAASITALSGADLEELGKNNVTEFISAVPGVTTIDQGGGWNRVIFRNVATAINEPGTSTTATYFDDFPVSTSTADVVPEIRLVDMNRVEVLKGPQGTLFGRSAMGGIVRYIPNRPNTQRLSAGVNTYVSSTKNGGVNFGLQGFANVPITDDLAIRVAGYTFQDDGFIDNIELGIKGYNDQTTNGGRFALHWQPTVKFSLDLTYLNQLTHGAPAYVTTTRDPGDPDVPGDEGPDVPPDVKARTMISGVDFKNNPSYDFLNLKLRYDFDGFDATFLATHGNSDLYLLLDDREYVDIHTGSIDLVDDFKRSSNVYELRFVSSTHGFLDWIAGAYYEDTKNDAFVNDTYHGPDQLLFGFYPLTDGAVAVNQRSKRTTKEKALYGELGFNFTRRTRLLLGYRYSDVDWKVRYSEANGFFDVWQGFDQWVGTTYGVQENVSTYKISLEHRFNRDLFGYALASSGYRPGGINPPTAISEFSTYGSDTLWNYELGLKKNWLGGLLATNISLYYIDWTDIQLVVQNPITFARETRNVGKAHIPGVELSVDYFVNENLRFFGGASFSDPELGEDVPPSIDPETGEPVYTGRKGDRLPGSAKTQFSVGFNWKQPIGHDMKVFASGLYRYVGDRLNDFNTDLDVKLSAYSLTDLRFGISYRDVWSLALFADNVFDEAITYSIIHQSPTFDAVPTNRPRTIGLNFIYNF